MNNRTNTVAAKAPGEPPTLFTIPEVCTIMRISRWSLYQLINKGRLRTIRIDRRRLVAAVDLEALIEQLRAEGGPCHGQ